MRLRLGGTDVPPICLRQKQKATRPSKTKVTNGPNAAAMNYRVGLRIERSTLRGDRDVIGQIDARKVRQEAL